MFKNYKLIFIHNFLFVVWLSGSMYDKGILVYHVPFFSGAHTQNTLKPHDMQKIKQEATQQGDTLC